MYWLLLLALLEPRLSFFTDDIDLVLAGDQGTLRLVVRNRSPFALEGLRLAARAGQPLELEVRPERIVSCRPAERCTFAITARRRADTPAARIPLDVQLHDGHGRRLLATRLFADASPGAGRRGRDWLDAGTIRVEPAAGATRRLLLLLAALLPVILLLGWGWYWRRRSAREAGG